MTKRKQADDAKGTHMVTIPLDPMTIPSIATEYLEKAAIVDDYARRYVMHGRYHETLTDAAEQAALDTKGIDDPREVKRMFRKAVRRMTARSGSPRSEPRRF